MDDDDDEGEPEMACYKLVDARQRHRDTPATFQVPTMPQLAAIKVGDYVKAIFEYQKNPKHPPRCTSERMWVCVEHHNPKSGVIIGILANEPICIGPKQLQWGDQITLHQVNVIDILDHVPTRILN